jgi:putative tryptophan/tyrosine transport system substrate-binding protein
VIRRRDFITLLGGAAAWPLRSHAQQSERVRRIGVLIPLAADDPQSQRRLTAFVQGLQELGWTDGRNIRIETRWTAGDTDRMRRHAAELVSLTPDVILASGGTVVGALLEASRTTPIVFTLTVDPVGAGHVASLARPGGNATGFTGYEYGLAAKWLELLKEIAPSVTRAAILRDMATPQGVGLFAVIRGASSALSMELRPVDVRNADEIERGITAVAREGNGGLIVTASGLAIVHRDLIISLADSNTISFTLAAWSLMGLIPWSRTDKRPNMLIASSRARTPAICRCRRRPSTSSQSTSRPPRRSASKFRPPCSPAPTR